MTSQIENPNENGEVAEEIKPAKRLDPGAKRNFVIIGGVILLAIAAVAFVAVGLGGKKQQEAPSSAVSLGTAPAERVENVSPDLAAKVQAKQQEEADAARRRGQSYVPPDTIGRTEPVEVVGTGPGPSQMGVQGVAVNQYAGANSEQDQRRREGLQRQLAGLLDGQASSGSQGGSTRQRVAFEQDQQQGQGASQRVAAAPTAGAAGAGGQPAASTSGTQQPRRTVLTSLSIHPAEISGAVSVPVNGSSPVLARINAGPAAGAMLFGQVRVSDENLDVTFTQMSLNGKTYQVQARALDEATSGMLLEGNVDRRPFQRYVIPIALAVAQGYFTARAQTGATITSIGGVGGATAAVSVPVPTTQQATAAGIARGMDIAGQEAQRQAQRPVLVKREAGYPIGVLFTAPVEE